MHDTVCPACLWTNDTISFKFLEAAGYGQISSLERKLSIPLNITLSPVNIAECHPNEGIKDHQICVANHAPIIDTCLGDSSVLQIKLLGNGKMNTFLIGVAASGQSCDTNTPSAYTTISPYIDWIESITKIDTNPRRCAFNYAKYREYEPEVILAKRHDMEYLDLTKFHVDVSEQRIYHIVQVGWREHGQNVNWYCSGVLITESFVLTLASCLNGFR